MCFVGHAYRPCPLQAMCFLLMHTTGLGYVGKSRQQLLLHLSDNYNNTDGARGGCALERALVLDSELFFFFSLEKPFVLLGTSALK